MATRTRRSSTKISVSRGPDVGSIAKVGLGAYGLGIIGTAVWLYTQAQRAGRTMDVSDVANSLAWPVTLATGGRGVMSPQMPPTDQPPTDQPPTDQPIHPSPDGTPPPSSRMQLATGHVFSGAIRDYRPTTAKT